MSKAPSMPMYWDSYLADTTHLTTEEHGAYLLLLAAMWRRDGSVPNDDRDNARILGLTKGKWRKIKERLAPFLTITDDEITQEKLQKTWKNTQEKIKKNRENGAKGGRPKTKENRDLAKANGSVSVNPNESIPEPEPEPYLDGDGSARAHTRGDLPSDATFRERILDAIGVNDLTSGRNSLNGATLGTPLDMHEANCWKTDLGLSEQEIIDMISDTMSRKRDGLPSKFSYFTGPMRRLAAAKAQPPLQPTEGDHYGTNSSSRTGARRHTGASSAHRNLLEGFQRAADRFGD